MRHQRLSKSAEKTKQSVARKVPCSTQRPLSSPILQLQRLLGNRRVAQLIQARRLTRQGKIIGFQRKLAAGGVDDQYEQEADHIARQVMSMPNAVAANSMQPIITRGDEDQNKTLQTQPVTASITPLEQRRTKNEEPEDKEMPLQAQLDEMGIKALQRQPVPEEDEKNEPVQAKSTGSKTDSFEAGIALESRLSYEKRGLSPRVAVLAHELPDTLQQKVNRSSVQVPTIQRLGEGEGGPIVLSCPPLPDPDRDWAHERWLCEMRQEPLSSNKRLLAPGAIGRSVELVHQVLQHWLCSMSKTEPPKHTLPDPTSSVFTVQSSAVVLDFQRFSHAPMKEGIVGPETIGLLDGYVGGPDVPPVDCGIPKPKPEPKQPCGPECYDFFGKLLPQDELPDSCDLCPRLPTPPESENITRLRQLLDNGEEERAIATMGVLTENDKHLVLESSEFKELAISAFDNDEMYRGVKAMRSDLYKSLEWMFDEGTDWAKVRDVINNTPFGKDTVRADNWMKTQFVCICNNKEMAEAVGLLGGTLTQQLSWMEAEGSNWALVKARILATTDAAQKAALYSSAAMRDFFVHVCNNKEMAEAVGLLGGTLTQQLNWMEAEGSNWALVKARILATTDAAQKAALYSSAAMRDFFVHVCNNKEMAEAVGLLGGTLTQQLNWMEAEGSNWALVKARILATTDAAQKIALYGNAAMRDFFVHVCNNKEMAEAVQLLGFNLGQKLDWMIVEDTNYNLVKVKVMSAPSADRAAVLGNQPLLRRLRDELGWNDFAKVIEILGRQAPTAATLLADPTVAAAMSAACRIFSRCHAATT